MSRATRAGLSLALGLAILAGTTVPQDERGRLRDFGVSVGVLPPGPLNAITDVAGVRVGHTTLRNGQDVNTGVTAILPHAGNLFREKVPAAVYVANGFGKLTGISQIQELGQLETPILLTGTLSVPRVADALISYMLELPGNEQVRSVNPVVGETNDGFLSDIRSRPITAGDVEAAIAGATSGAVSEGAVGAGTGTVAFGFKGGIGTASRVLPAALGSWTVGVLVQTNFGGVLQVAGAPVGVELGRYYLRGVVEGRPDLMPDPVDGSCMIVIATDAPLDAAALERLALRAFMGMAKTGASGSNGSGDYILAFSSYAGLRSGPDGALHERGSPLPTDELSPLFYAAIEASEEAIYNSLFAATTTRGARGVIEALPIPETLEILRRHGIGPTPPR